MILDVLIEDKSCKLASAAAVSREWQAAIEPHTFAHIRLPPMRIAQLNSMTQHSRSLVRSLSFCIELARYDCTKCVSDGFRSGETNHDDNDLILEAFQSLFSALSTRKPNGRLALDISLYSNSDNEHALKYLTFVPDTPGRGTHPYTQRRPPMYAVHNVFQPLAPMTALQCVRLTAIALHLPVLILGGCWEAASAVGLLSTAANMANYLSPPLGIGRLKSRRKLWPYSRGNIYLSVSGVQLRHAWYHFAVIWTSIA